MHLCCKMNSKHSLPVVSVVQSFVLHSLFCWYKGCERDSVLMCVNVSLCMRCGMREDTCERKEENMHVCVCVLNVLPSGQCAPLFLR